jgi:hypothetical protein
LGWTNRLGIDGSLAVVNAIPTTPPPLAFTVTDSTLQLSWPAGHIGWRLEAQTNSLASGLGTNWTRVSGSSTTNFVAFPIVSTEVAVFYRLTYP